MGLPRPAPELLSPADPLDELAGRSSRLAAIVEAISRRRDVRATRARLVLLLLELACPLGSSPRVGWYVPGAVARMGPLALRRAWLRRHGRGAPSERTLRGHLSALEGALVLVREPGRYLPRLWSAEAPERRPRWPDTVHLVYTEDEALWWAGEGRRILELAPRARRCPGAWRELVGDWRARARRAAAAEPVQLVLPFGVEEIAAPARAASASAPSPEAAKGAAPATSAARLELGRALARAALGSATARPARGGAGSAEEAFELARAVRDAGVALEGKHAWGLAARPRRFRHAVALLAVALLRGDRVRSPAGWLVRAARAASEVEGVGALSTLARGRP